MILQTNNTPSSIASCYVDLINQGSLTLVNETFNSWAKNLTYTIERLMSQSNLYLLHGQLIGASWKVLTKNIHLKNQFSDLCRHYLDSEQINLLYKLLIRKTFNVFSKEILKQMSVTLSKTKGTLRGDLKAVEKKKIVKVMKKPEIKIKLSNNEINRKTYNWLYHFLIITFDSFRRDIDLDFDQEHH